MKTIEVDVAVIGAGTAGMTAYREARLYTDKVVLIEGGSYGTTCARVGCMPSKLLIAAADAARQARQAAELGIYAENLSIQGKEVMARLQAERDRFVGFVLESLESLPASAKLEGYARFIDPQTLEVGQHTRVKAKATVIATGSSPFLPPLLQGLGERLLTTDQIFELPDLPSSLAVFGGGAIGLELGQAFSALGVRVQLFGIEGMVGALTDPKVKAEADTIFAADFGFQSRSEVQKVSLSDNRQQLEVTYLNPHQQAETACFDYLLAATGRRPNLKALKLEALGLELDKAGLPPFDPHSLQVGELPVFLAGDVNNERPLLHEAVDEGKVAGFNAVHYPEHRPGQRRSALSIAFTHPQLAMVGSRFADLPEDCTAIGEVSFDNQGRSRVILENRGLLRIYAEHGSGRFLGAEMLAPRAEHLAHLLAWAHQQQLSIAQMLELPFYHPVIEEGLRSALQDTLKALQQGPPVSAPCYPELAGLSG